MSERACCCGRTGQSCAATSDLCGSSGAWPKCAPKCCSCGQRVCARCINAAQPLLHYLAAANLSFFCWVCAKCARRHETQHQFVRIVRDRAVPHPQTTRRRCSSFEHGRAVRRAAPSARTSRLRQINLISLRKWKASERTYAKLPRPSALYRVWWALIKSGTQNNE